MTQTINVPFLRQELNYGVSLYLPDLTLVTADTQLTQIGSTHVWSATTEESGKLLFDVVDLNNGSASVEPMPRIRTLANDGETYTILTGLDDAAAGASSFNPNGSDDDLFSTGWLITYGHVYDETTGWRENGVPITVTLTSGPGVAGFGLDTQARTVVSETVTIESVQQHGYVEIPGLRRGATYSVSRGGSLSGSSDNPFATRSPAASGSFVVPDSPSFAIVEVLGSEP